MRIVHIAKAITSLIRDTSSNPSVAINSKGQKEKDAQAAADSLRDGLVSLLE